MPGVAGPPTVPPIGPLATDENTPARKYPRPRFDARGRWSWLVGAVFALLAVAVKLPLREFNPPAFFVGLAALVTATGLWRWLMPPPPAATFARGGVVGAAIGLLLPPVAWLLWSLNLLLSDPEPLKALVWTFAFAIATLAPVAGVSVLIGALLGAALGAIERASAR